MTLTKINPTEPFDLFSQRYPFFVSDGGFESDVIGRMTTGRMGPHTCSKKMGIWCVKEFKIFHNTERQEVLNDVARGVNGLESGLRQAGLKNPLSGVCSLSSVSQNTRVDVNHLLQYGGVSDTPH
jgi:hypothetical protein